MSLLHRSIKVTTEMPHGLRANMLRMYDQARWSRRAASSPAHALRFTRAPPQVSEQQFARCTKPAKYKKLLYALVYFHSVVLERKKFQSLGWNVPYSFNDSDFGCAALPRGTRTQGLTRRAQRMREPSVAVPG